MADKRIVFLLFQHVMATTLLRSRTGLSDPLYERKVWFLFQNEMVFHFEMKWNIPSLFDIYTGFTTLLMKVHERWNTIKGAETFSAFSTRWGH
jgi:hypothetical protein